MSSAGDAASGRRLRRLFGRLAVSHDEIEAEQLRAEAVDAGGTPIAECGEREQVTICGDLRTVTFRPRAGVPALEAELYDGSGTVSLVWLGRRRIAGIEPGRGILATGRVATNEGHRVIFNPRYELRPRGGGA